MKSHTLILTTLIAAALPSGAVVLADFTMEEHLGASNNLSFDTNGSPQNTLSATSTLATGLSNPNLYGRGTLGTGNGGTQSGELNWSAWTSNAEFFVVELTVDAGTTITLSDLTMDISRNGTGAPLNWYAVVLPGTGLTGAAIGAGTHLDQQAVTIGANAGGSVGLTRTWDLSSAADLTAGSYTIALGTPGGTGGNMRVSDVVINGTVPEPSSAALMGLGGLAFILRRRR